MAASASDKARKSYSYLQKTLSSQISDSDTTLTPNNVTNIPTDTGVSFVVDRVDSSGTKTPTKRELMTGRVSAGTITGLLRGQHGTTAQTHLANAVIEFVNSGAMWNDLIDFMLQDHSNPNGNHKSLTDDNGNEWLERGSTASAVNQVKITNAATGNAVRVDASGDDSNVDLYLGSKGSSGVAHVENPELFSNFIVSSTGAIAQSSGLIGTFANITYYISGKRYKKTSIANKTYTASKDTYVDIDTSGTVTYVEVANGATSGMTLTANSIRVAKVVTNGSAITSVTQTGYDPLGNPIKRISPIAPVNAAGDAAWSYTLRGSNFTTTSASLVDITGGSLSQTLVSHGGKIAGIVSFSAKVSTNTAQLAVNIDGATTNIAQLSSTTSKYYSFPFVVSGIAAGIHTIKIQVSIPGGATFTADIFETQTLMVWELGT